jgi:hypothetical protein
MKKFTVYANCQGPALAKTLLETKGFRDVYEYQRIKPVQTLKSEDFDQVKNTVAESDLILCQPILSPSRPQKGAGGMLKFIKSLVRQTIPAMRRPAWTGTKDLLKYAAKDAEVYSFPSLYFNAYFPHLDALNIRSVLNRVHDFFIAYSYVKGNSVEKTLRLINSEKLYPQEMSLSLADRSLNELKKREDVNKVSFTISEFIERNFKTTKLFNQFNHPKKPVFVFLAQKILSELKIDFSLDEFSTTTGLDGTSIPTQKSTYANLGFAFEEDFKSYRISPTQFMSQEDVVKEYYKTYDSVDKKLIKSLVKRRKGFVCDLVDGY